MQLASSRLWTHVAVSIFYDDNHYTMGTLPNFIAVYQIFCSPIEDKHFAIIDWHKALQIVKLINAKGKGNIKHTKTK